MERRQLGRTGLVVAELGLGGARLLGHAGDQPPKRANELVARAIERGVDYFDTAECYLDGRAERVLSRALGRHSKDVVLATKFGHRPQHFDFSREQVLESVQQSRRNLDGRVIDVLQLHTPAEPDWTRMAGAQGALAGMLEARERGWCRFLGITGMDLPFLRRCIDTDIFDSMLVFLRYDLLDRTAAPVLAEASAHAMGIVVGSPLRMGLFGAVRAAVQRQLSAVEQRQLAALEALFASEPGGITAAALRFILTSDAVSVVLIGADSVEHLDQAINLATTPMTDAARAAVEHITTLH